MRGWRTSAVLVAASSVVVAGLPATTSTATHPAVPVQRLAGQGRVATAVAVSAATYPGADEVVLVRADEFADALTAAPLAAAVRGPVLLTTPDSVPAEVEDELDRLGAERIVLLGGEHALSSELEDDLTQRFTVRRVGGSDRYRTAADVADELPGATGALVASGESFADALSAAPLAAHLGWPLLLTRQDRLPAATRARLEEAAPDEILVVGGELAVGPDVADELRTLAPTVRRLAGPDRYGTGTAVHAEALRRGMGSSTLWLATGRAFPDALAAGPAAAASGASLVLVDGRDLRGPAHLASHLRSLSAGLERVVLLGGPAAVTAESDWQLPVVLQGRLLPRGGHLLFPEHRMVAFYGHHSSAAMGVLGEQPPDQAFERLWSQAQPYGAGGRPLLPTFELIVSVATAGPGPDGDYSAPSTPEQIQPWLDAARRHGVYLLLDLQTGHTDFLTEARRYEQFLTQPDVGLALDPEWRMDADEVPAQSVGEVHASEVNAVADYLSDLVRRHHLPEKLLVIHQFQTRMVEDKHLIGNPPELAVLFHMDGHGSRAQKQNTYGHVSDTTGRWWNGFKLFYDEDSQMYTPHELLAEVRPVPDFISYQ